MTSESRRLDGCGTDGAAYVLGALEPDEAEVFRRHLSDCSICRDEVTALQRVADVLPLAAPQYRARAVLRRRVMGAVRGKSRQRTRVSVPVLAAAALAVAILAIATLTIASIGSGNATGTRLVPAEVIASSGNAELRIRAGHAELLVRRLAAPARGRVYEVWLKRPNAAPAPTDALFSVNPEGAADIGLPGSLHAVSEVLVTEEPAGGSRVPTGPPVIVAPTS